jgi:hypothetical protein
VSAGWHFIGIVDGTMEHSWEIVTFIDQDKTLQNVLHPIEFNGWQA